MQKGIIKILEDWYNRDSIWKIEGLTEHNNELSFCVRFIDRYIQPLYINKENCKSVKDEYQSILQQML